MKAVSFFLRLALLSFLFSFALQAAILDDLVEKIQQKTSDTFTHKKHHKRYQTHYHTRTLSKDAQWQKALQFLGYYHGRIDGDLSTQRSFDAITAFHHKHHQIETGFLEEEDKAYLSEVYHTIRLESYLSYEGKSKRRNHQKIQAALAVKSLYKGKIDGLLGKASKKALNRYRSQIQSNTPLSDNEVKQRVVQEAKEKIAMEIEKIKEDTFDPATYAKAPIEEDILAK